MATQTRLVDLSNDSEDSPSNGKKTQVSNASTNHPDPSKHTSQLFSSPNLQSTTPYGRAHAGEVRRRTDRQTGPLPAPRAGQSSSANSTNGFSRRQRRPNGSGTGGYNSDSDSDDDRKHRKRYDGRDDDVGILINREKRPASSSSHYAEASSIPSPLVDEEEEERFRRSMQQTLALVEEKMSHYASPSMQREQMADLVLSMPPHTRPGAIRSETYDFMLAYIEQLEVKTIESNTTALMRQQDSSSESEEAWKREEFRKMVRFGKVTFKLVELPTKSPCLIDIPGFYESSKYSGVSKYITVLRVLVKGGTPRFAEVVSPQLLHDLGWWFSYETGTWCQNYADHWNKFSGRVIFQVEITGNITKIWEVTDADEDSGFQRFLERENHKKYLNAASQR